jgi:hypothetical protein
MKIERLEASVINNEIRSINLYPAIERQTSERAICMKPASLNAGERKPQWVTQGIRLKSRTES